MITTAHKTELARFDEFRSNMIGVDMQKNKSRLKLLQDLQKMGYVIPMKEHEGFMYFKLNKK